MRTRSSREIGVRIGEWGDGSYYPLELPPDIYQWPIYLLGEPGMGKSTLLANLALQLNTLGEGVVVIDHKDGQLSRDIVERADPNKLVYVSPGQCFFDGHPHHWGLNILEVTKRDRLGFATTRANVMSMFVRMERADFAIMQQMRLYLDRSTSVRHGCKVDPNVLKSVYQIPDEIPGAGGGLVQLRLACFGFLSDAK